MLLPDETLRQAGKKYAAEKVPIQGPTHYVKVKHEQGPFNEVVIPCQNIRAASLIHTEFDNAIVEMSEDEKHRRELHMAFNNGGGWVAIRIQAISTVCEVDGVETYSISKDQLNEILGIKDHTQG